MLPFFFWICSSVSLEQGCNMNSFRFLYLNATAELMIVRRLELCRGQWDPASISESKVKHRCPCRKVSRFQKKLLAVASCA